MPPRGRRDGQGHRCMCEGKTSQSEARTRVRTAELTCVKASQSLGARVRDACVRLNGQSQRARASARVYVRVRLRVCVCACAYACAHTPVGEPAIRVQA
eukprot:2379427-Pleurochrysis_carterae.AAC.2